jgi:hypothetical protein
MLSENEGFRCQVSVFSPAAGRGAASQIEKETNEHRTSNNVFCLFYKRLSEAIPPFDIRYSAVLRFAFNFVFHMRTAAGLNSGQFNQKNYVILA